MVQSVLIKEQLNFEHYDMCKSTVGVYFGAFHYTLELELPEFMTFSISRNALGISGWEVRRTWPTLSSQSNMAAPIINIERTLCTLAT